MENLNKTHFLFFCMIIAGFLSGCQNQSSPARYFAKEKIEHATVTATHTITHGPTITFTATKLPASSPTKTDIPTASPTQTQTETPAISLEPLPDIIFHGNREKKMVALTFDICEDPQYPSGYETGIEWYLNLTDTPATFFISGHWMKRNPDIVLQLAENPLFEIGNHSWSHPDFRDLESWEIEEQISLTNDEFNQITGQEITLFRLPGGTYYPYTLSEIQMQDLAVIQWDVVTADPIPDNDADNILEIVKSNTQNGSIIIMHANGRGWHTEEALPRIITWLRKSGYEIVTISMLLEEAGYELPLQP